MDILSIALLLALLVLGFWLFSPQKPRQIRRQRKQREIISVPTRNVLEVRIDQMSCAFCDGTIRIEQIEGEVVEGEHLRLAHVQCVEHGHKDIIPFRLENESTP